MKKAKKWLLGVLAASLALVAVAGVAWGAHTYGYHLAMLRHGSLHEAQKILTYETIWRFRGDDQRLKEWLLDELDHQQLVLEQTIPVVDGDLQHQLKRSLERYAALAETVRETAPSIEARR